MNKKRDGHSFRMRACQRCGGDAYKDRREDNEWRCLQCGRTVAVLPEAAVRHAVHAA